MDDHQTTIDEMAEIDAILERQKDMIGVPELPSIGTIWRHLKTKHHYVVVGECQMEATWEPGILYARIDGYTERPIARSRAKFMDGRFTALPTPPEMPK